MTPQRKKARCSKLFVNGEVVRDPKTLLNIWASHFQKLAESRLDETDKGKDRGLRCWKICHTKMKSSCWMCLSQQMRLLYRRLKKRKTPGPDGLMAEHLKGGGEAVVIWLMKILKAIVELKSVPMVLKKGVVVPVYKGGGTDP